MSIEHTLAEREKQHGNFTDHCTIEFALRHLLEMNPCLNTTQQIGLGMIMHKIARILNNGHDHKDSWHDIAGYALLVEKSIDE